MLFQLLTEKVVGDFSIFHFKSVISYIVCLKFAFNINHFYIGINLLEVKKHKNISSYTYTQSNVEYQTI